MMVIKSFDLLMVILMVLFISLGVVAHFLVKAELKKQKESTES